MESRKRISIILILSLLFTLVSTMGASNVFAIDSKDDLVLYARVDCLDYSEKPARLAVDVMADRDGKAFFYASMPGETYTLEALKRQGQPVDYVDVKKGKETTLFSSNTVTEGQSYDCQVVFVDNSGAEYGPYIMADEKAKYFPAGKGTIAYPYQIWTPRQFYNLRSLEGKTEKNNAVVMDQLNMNQVTLKGQIGSVGGTFYGTLDGNKYTVGNITGRIFSNLAKGARISNLNLQGDKITSTSYFTENNYGIIENCNVGPGERDVYMKGTSKQPMGIVANFNYGTITNCGANSLWISEDSEVGGIAGRNMGIINKCISQGSIRATAENGIAGGIVGRNAGGTVMDCTYWMMPQGESPEGSIIGGIAGVNEGSLTRNSSEFQADANSSRGGSIVGQWSEDSIATDNYGAMKKTPDFTLDANGNPTTPEQQVKLKKEWKIRNGKYGTLPLLYKMSQRNSTSTGFRPAQLAQVTLDRYPSTTVEYNKVNPMVLLSGGTDEITLANYNGSILMDYSATYGRGKDYEAKVIMPKAGAIVVDYDFTLNPEGNTIELYNSQGVKVKSVAVDEVEPKDKVYISIAKAGTYKLKISSSVNEPRKAVFNMGYAPVGGTLSNKRAFLGSSPNGTTAYYKITVPSDGYISLSTLMPGKKDGVKSEIRLMNSKKKNLLKNGQKINGGAYYEPTVGLKKGNYYLAVKCAESAYTIQYNFKSIKEKSGATRGKAVSIPKGTERNGIIEVTDNASSADWYKIVVKKTQKVRLWVTPYGWKNLKTSIYKGNSSKAMTIKYPKPGTTSVLYRTLKPGTYYIKMNKYGTGVGSGGYNIHW